jgi:Effector protein
MFLPPETELDDEPETWSFSSYFDPWQYLPVGLGGYTERQARITQNPEPQFGHADFPKDAAQAFRRAFLVIAPSKRKQRPDDLWLEEYQETAQLLGQIYRGATGLGIFPNLADEKMKGADDQKLKLITETLKDVIEIARTVVGRALLTELARAAKTARVTIEASDRTTTPTAQPMFSGKPLDAPQRSQVVYTPTAFKTGLAENYRDNLAKQEQLKQHNPWLMPHRSDISLLHELIHGFHFQKGTTIAKETLVSARDAVDAADAPFTEGQFDQQVTSGVREEEYATVGLGPYRGDRYTENAYRAERRAMGENVPDRAYYTTKDQYGQRLREYTGGF